jgi:chromosome segregation ATPase
MATKTKKPEVEQRTLEQASRERDNAMDAIQTLTETLSNLTTEVDAATAEEQRLTMEQIRKGLPAKPSPAVRELQAKREETERALRSANILKLRLDHEVTSMLIEENSREQREAGGRVLEAEAELQEVQSRLAAAQNAAAMARDHGYGLRDQLREVARRLSQIDPTFFTVKEPEEFILTDEQRAQMNAELGARAGFARLPAAVADGLKDNDPTHSVKLGPPIPPRDTGEGEG